MFTQTGNENSFDLSHLFITHLLTFVLGVVAGFVANWAWDKYKNGKKDPHLQLKTDSNGTYFSGVLNSSNKDQVINTLSYSVTSTSMNKDYKASRTDIAPSHGRDLSTL